MEQVFGVSYPTIKARLNRISSALEFVDSTPPEQLTGRSPVICVAPDSVIFQPSPSGAKPRFSSHIGSSL